MRALSVFLAAALLSACGTTGADLVDERKALSKVAVVSMIGDQFQVTQFEGFAQTPKSRVIAVPSWQLDASIESTANTMIQDAKRFTVAKVGGARSQMGNVSIAYNVITGYPETESAHPGAIAVAKESGADLVLLITTRTTADEATGAQIKGYGLTQKADFLGKSVDAYLVVQALLFDGATGGVVAASREFSGVKRAATDWIAGETFTPEAEKSNRAAIEQMAQTSIPAILDNLRLLRQVMAPQPATTYTPGAAPADPWGPPSPAAPRAPWPPQ
jgi:hypothetical protein